MFHIVSVKVFRIKSDVTQKFEFLKMDINGREGNFDKTRIVIPCRGEQSYLWLDRIIIPCNNPYANSFLESITTMKLVQYACNDHLYLLTVIKSVTISCNLLALSVHFVYTPPFFFYSCGLVRTPLCFLPHIYS